MRDAYQASGGQTLLEQGIRLAEQEFYDGTVFHRVLPGFMAQGGSPEGKGMGGPGWTIDLETNASLRHERGALAMARKREPNSAGSQFYICYDPQPGLDDKYAVFGKIVRGMEVVDGDAARRLQERLVVDLIEARGGPAPASCPAGPEGPADDARVLDADRDAVPVAAPR